ncbi:hypothetical protein FE784_11635 [Paenibacillus hemerocallicola]|uniref:Uncharacterized protein n=1 Tax=Paenibacillus hemerocallicola TaxID=1172614 RepID=A0A5C4TAJ1_9BACL|nr:hypothetical protein [Paenibacillus hemerocallicola]TNJ66068.1 hypothetical protein FE784_11635 [Paenibacillus hemerocallicola]
MEDVVVAFILGEDGWIYFDHPCQNIVEKFKWEIDDHGLLQINRTTSTVFYDVEDGDELAQDSYFDEPSNMVIPDIKVDINKESTPRGENEVIIYF